MSGITSDDLKLIEYYLMVIATCSAGAFFLLFFGFCDITSKLGRIAVVLEEIREKL